MSAHLPALEEKISSQLHIYVSIIVWWHICQIYADTSRCWHICRHVEMSVHSVRNTPTYVNTFVVLITEAYMLTCPNADIYADTLRCWHICQHIEMPTYSSSSGKYADIYVNTFLECWQICRHIEMPTYMLTHQDDDICRHYVSTSGLLELLGSSAKGHSQAMPLNWCLIVE